MPARTHLKKIALSVEDGFKFEPVTTRYVKLQIVSFVHGDGPNGNICTMQLYGPRQLKRAGS